MWTCHKTSFTNLSFITRISLTFSFVSVGADLKHQFIKPFLFKFKSLNKKKRYYVIDAIDKTQRKNNCLKFEYELIDIIWLVITDINKIKRIFILSGLFYDRMIINVITLYKMITYNIIQHIESILHMTIAIKANAFHWVIYIIHRGFYSQTYTIVRRILTTTRL